LSGLDAFGVGRLAHGLSGKKCRSRGVKEMAAGDGRHDHMLDTEADPENRKAAVFVS